MTSRYAEVLRAPEVAPLLAASLVARMPIGIEGLATILFLREQRGSFAVGGAVAGALVLGGTVGNPVVSRLVDRLGVRRVLVPIAILHAVALAALIAAGLAGAPAAVLVAAAAAAGFGIPPTSSVLRSLWPQLLKARPDLLPTAYALDSILIELIFVGGPLLTAAVVIVSSPVVVLALSALGVGAGTAAFVVRPPVRAIAADGAAGSAGVLGALATPGMRTLVFAMVPAGLAFGAIEVTLPAFGAEHGAAAWGGVLLATWSLGSALGGFVYGARERRADLVTLWVGFMAAVPVGLLPMTLAGSVWSMLVLIIPAGLVIAPLLATTNMLIGRVAPPGSATEAYTWPLTALTAGIAAGNALGGSLAQAQGWRAGVALGLAAGTAAILLAMARRHTIGAAPGTRARPAEVP